MTENAEPIPYPDPVDAAVATGDPEAIKAALRRQDVEREARRLGILLEAKLEGFRACHDLIVAADPEGRRLIMQFRLDLDAELRKIKRNIDDADRRLDEAVAELPDGFDPRLRDRQRDAVALVALVLAEGFQMEAIREVLKPWWGAERELLTMVLAVFGLVAGWHPDIEEVRERLADRALGLAARSSPSCSSPV